MEAGYFPLTFPGVVAFSRRRGRILLCWLSLSFLGSCVLVSWLHLHCLPVAERVMKALPEGLVLAGGALGPLPEEFQKGARNTYLHLEVSGKPREIGHHSDLRIQATPRGLDVDTLAGGAFLPWPPGLELIYSPSRFLPWWQSQRAMILALCLAGLMAAKLLAGALLCVLAALPSRIIFALFGHRASLADHGALAAASLLPGGLLCVLSLFGYAMGWLNLLALLCLLGAHLLLHGIYFLGSVFHLPSGQAVPAGSPFSEPDEEPNDSSLSASSAKKSRNPFSPGS